MCADVDDVAKLGGLLRKALADHIRSEINNGRVMRSGKRINFDVEEVIRRHLPDGITFERAEAVLQSAGFAFDPRPAPGSPRRFGTQEDFDVIAFLGFGRERFEGGRCIVALRPEVPYDYSQVHRILTTCGYWGAMPQPERNRSMIDRLLRRRSEPR